MSNDITDAPLRIAITGKIRAGKSSIATYLEWYYGFSRVSFGSTLKRHADELLGDSPAYPTEVIGLGTPCMFSGELRTRKPRRLYQDFGQAMRALDPDIWVRHAAQLVEALSDRRSVNGIVIDDMRQPNEEKWARENGFTIIRVNANEDTRLQRARVAGDSFTVADLRHETEMHVDDFEIDYEIDNNGDDTDELRREIDAIVSELSEGSR